MALRICQIELCSFLYFSLNKCASFKKTLKTYNLSQIGGYEIVFFKFAIVKDSNHILTKHFQVI